MPAASRPGDGRARGAARPVGGAHWPEWGSELAGTALLLGLGFSAVAVLVSPRSPVARALDGSGVRFLAVGIVFGALVAAIAASPIGRRSGAHLNPAVTLAFWLRGDVHRHDLLGYTLSQAAGAFIGTGLFALACGPWASSIDYARTTPDPVGALAGVGIEAALTLALVGSILASLSIARLQAHAPVLVAAVLALLVWAGSPPTGAGLNPARSLAPAVAAHDYASLWVYVAGPLAGAIAATLAAALAAPGRRTLTAKLCHDPRYRSTMRTQLPARPATR